jgi:hypothetical protein
MAKHPFQITLGEYHSQAEKIYNIFISAAPNLILNRAENS